MTNVTTNKFHKQTCQSSNSLHAQKYIQSSSNIEYFIQGVSCYLSPNIYRRVSLALKSLHLVPMWDNTFFLIRLVFGAISNFCCSKQQISYVLSKIINNIVALSKHTKISCHRRFLSTSVTSSHETITIRIFVLANIPI